MLKIKELRISGIGRFVDEQVVRFDSLGNLVQVDGENRNTNGSSGSGKSTLFNALDYLLGLNDLPTTVLQSRLTKDAMHVVGTFDWDDKNLVITRGKKGLKIEVDGVPTEGSSKLTEEKLEGILGMPSHLFRKMLHKRQKEGGFFLDFTPKQMYEFLTDCLNLSDLRKKIQIVEDKIKSLEIDKTSATNGLTANRSALKATQDGILALGMAPIKDIHQPVILDLKNKFDLATANFNKVQENQKNETQELEKQRPQVSTPIFDRSKQEDLELKRKELDNTANSLNYAERDRQSAVNSSISQKRSEQSTLSYQVSQAETAQQQSREIAAQVKKIRDAICPTCDQTWLTETAKTKEQELQQKLISNLAIIKTGNAAAEKIKLISAELAELTIQQAPIVDPRIAELQAEARSVDVQIAEEKKKAEEFYNFHQSNARNIQNEFASKQAELRQKQAIELDQVRGQMDVDRRAFEAAVAKLKAYEDARTRYETALKSMKDKEAQYTENDKRIDQILMSVTVELEKAEELKKALKSYASVSFDEALEAVGDTATRIIRCIPNMSNATIQFEGTKETKEGKVKEEVNAVISMDGESGIPIKSLSGGERSSVDLAVDLAVIDYLESKTGKGIDVFILDEPFTGLDTVSIEMALEVLKNSNINKKLIIVDHNPEVKQMVTSRLVVVRDGTTSSVVQP